MGTSAILACLLAVPVAVAAPVAMAGPPFADRYIARVAPLAERMSRVYRVPASVAIGQSALESNWGRSRLTVQDRNYFGIKCIGGWPGPIAVSCRTYPTRERGLGTIRAQF